MNIKRRRKFAILMAIVGCLIANSSLKLDAVTLSAEEVASIILNEMIFPTVDANNLLTDAISSRMTSVKGCLANPFVYGLYVHTNRNNIVSGYSPKSDMPGFTLGMDYVWTFDNEKYFRLGAAFGYVHGKTTPLR
ncbi:MAG: autotransporter outer membrane beta-barrel domain-containing protein, partial [Puniceicoccales bacterium]|nr:autotransporter outer membrane beta-barrel domain-containing protein [Puniceicoccales bacterium]